MPSSPLRGGLWRRSKPFPIATTRCFTEKGHRYWICSSTTFGDEVGLGRKRGGSGEHAVRDGMKQINATMSTNLTSCLIIIQSWLKMVRHQPEMLSSSRSSLSSWSSTVVAYNDTYSSGCVTLSFGSDPIGHLGNGVKRSTKW